MPWPDRLRSLLEANRYTTQSAISEALASEGIVLNQATISRELKRMGARKVGGVYQLPRQQIAAPVHRMSVTASGCLIVLQTAPAFASVLAQRIDHARNSAVLGTIAGDDTVFVATTGAEGVAAVRHILGLPD